MTASSESSSAWSPGPASEAAFAWKLSEARAPLLAFAQRVAPKDAEDLCQDTLARALRYRERFDARRPLLPWLRTLLLHRSADRFRRPVHRALEIEPEAPQQEDSPSDRVATLLSCLEPADAALLYAFHLDQRSIADIAQELGQPEGTLRSRLHRARRKLARLRVEEDFR